MTPSVSASLFYFFLLFSYIYLTTITFIISLSCLLKLIKYGLPVKHKLICLLLFPQIAAEVAAPLAKTEEIVMVGGGDTMSNAITKMCGELPPAVHALTGVDLTKVCLPYYP